MKSIVAPRTYGRLGNFLFQSAAGIGFARRHGLDFTVPFSTNDAKWNPIYFPHLRHPGFHTLFPVATPVLIKEKGHNYQELQCLEEWKENCIIVLDGYWQTEKYFLEFREDVLRAFELPWWSEKDVVSVHVRRTDYITLFRKHPVVPAEWIKKQMAGFVGFRFKFFSDDIPWCKEQFGRHKDVEFSEGKTEMEDLIEMSRCEHHICSASTFSWWGAWLNQNPNKHVIMPKLWFVPGHGNLDTSDIVPSNWKRV